MSTESKVNVFTTVFVGVFVAAIDHGLTGFSSTFQKVYSVYSVWCVDVGVFGTLIVEVTNFIRVVNISLINDRTAVTYFFDSLDSEVVNAALIKKEASFQVAVVLSVVWFTDNKGGNFGLFIDCSTVIDWLV